MPHESNDQLLGRHGEIETLDRLLREVREGHSRVLTLRGEAGIGKSALLDHLAVRTAGVRVVRVAGSEAESDFAYAALQSLCAPILSHLDSLPPVQREALRVAFGLSSGAAPEIDPPRPVRRDPGVTGRGRGRRAGRVSELLDDHHGDAHRLPGAGAPSPGTDRSPGTGGRTPRPGPGGGRRGVRAGDAPQQPGAPSGRAAGRRARADVPRHFPASLGSDRIRRGGGSDG